MLLNVLSLGVRDQFRPTGGDFMLLGVVLDFLMFARITIQPFMSITSAGRKNVAVLITPSSAL
jgi:hypothetical protein